MTLSIELHVCLWRHAIAHSWNCFFADFTADPEDLTAALQDYPVAGLFPRSPADRAEITISDIRPGCTHAVPSFRLRVDHEL